MKYLLNRLTPQEQEFAIDLLAGFVDMQEKKRVALTERSDNVACQDTENENSTS